MATALLLVLLQACCLLVNFDPPQQAGNTIPPAQSATKAPGDHKAGPRTPEETIKAFVTAMFDEDQDGIRRTALPNPRSGLALAGRQADCCSKGDGDRRVEVVAFSPAQGGRRGAASRRKEIRDRRESRRRAAPDDLRHRFSASVPACEGGPGVEGRCQPGHREPKSSRGGQATPGHAKRARDKVSVGRPAAEGSCSDQWGCWFRIHARLSPLGTAQLAAAAQSQGALKNCNEVLSRKPGWPSAGQR